jgi:hypothetical protein
MATYVITGRNVRLNITGLGTTALDEQTTTATLTKTNDRQVFQTLLAENYKTTNLEATFDLEMMADWGKSGSVCEAIWALAETAPDTAIDAVLTTVTNHTFAFKIFPDFPTAGGGGTDMQTVTFSFKVEKGAVTDTLAGNA